MHQADDDVRHLHAGIVDVVLHIHALSCGAQHPHEGVAQDGVAQMPDMRCLVRIDAGVLHQRVHACAESSVLLRLRDCRQRSAAIEPRVQISRACDLKARETWQGWLFSDSSSSAAICFGARRSGRASSKAIGRRVVAHRDLGWLLQV